MRIIYLSLIAAVGLLTASCGQAQTQTKAQAQPKKNKYPDPSIANHNTVYPMKLTDAEWKARLTDFQYYVLRQEGTERAGTGKYDHFDKKGTYYSAASLQPVFSSDAKFDSGTGWPSFDQALPGSVKEVSDDALGMSRTEIVCAKCCSHLGHVFDDGPTETGKRYCLNSVCLDLEEGK